MPRLFSGVCTLFSQYASGSFQRVLDTHGIAYSMSRKGDCYDNAVIESFFGTLNTELEEPFD